MEATIPGQKRDEIFAWGINRAGVQACDEQLAAMLEVLGPERVALIRSNHYFG